MKKRGSAVNRGLAACLCALAVSEPAQAYIDPGTGTLMIQWLLGLVFAGLALMKMYWQQAKLFIADKFGKSDASSATDTDSGEASKAE